jgi:hypothetical protein
MTMKAALILCPFFTNGDYPPLGIASINGALRDAGHETACFDFCWLAYREGEGEFHLIRQFFGVGVVSDEVVFVLEPELGLSLLFREDESSRPFGPGFTWRLSADPEVKRAAGMLYLGLRQMMPGWAEQVLAEKPDAVFFSTYASNVFISLYLAKQIRKLREDLPVIFGGPGVSLPEMQEFILSLGLVDAVVVGEGELTVRELCSDLKKNLQAGVPGLAIRSNGSVSFEPRALAKDLDSLPSSSFEGFPLPGLGYEAYKSNRPNRYLTPFFEGLPVASTRGCVNRCAYCSETAYWARFRQRKVDTLIEQIRGLHERFGETHFLFSESAFNGNPGWVKKFCEKANSLPFQPVFSSLLIADRSIDEALASMMYQAGFRYGVLGVETFSRAIRERMNKSAVEEEIFSSILALTRAGIHVKANLLVGFPGESDEEFETSLRQIERWAGLSREDRGPGTLYWDAGHRVRLEAYSGLFHHPERYGITILPREIPLPDRLSYLKKPLSKMMFRWSMSLDKDTIQRRSERMKEAARKALD